MKLTTIVFLRTTDTPHRRAAESEIIRLRTQVRLAQKQLNDGFAKTRRENPLGSPDTTPQMKTGAACELSMDKPQIDKGAVATLSLHSTCGQIPLVAVAYGNRSLEQLPDGDKIRLDLFAGATEVRITDPRGGIVQWSPPESAFKGVAKAVLIWSTPVDLDLKVKEYSARLGNNAGYLWAGQRGSLADAQDTGRGFISAVDDGGRGQDHVEVYTFLEGSRSPRGEVTFGVELGGNETALSCVPEGDKRYETYLLVNGVRKDSNRSLVSTVDCTLASRSDEQRKLRGFQSHLTTPF